LTQGAIAAQRALAVKAGDAKFLRAKIAIARFYADHRLAGAPARLSAAAGGATVMGCDPEWL